MNTRRTARSGGVGAVVLVTLALLVVGLGIGGRVAAPAMAKADCWQLGGDQGIAIRVICAGDADIGGFCAGLADSSSSQLNPAAAACAFPALELQKVSMGTAVAVSLALAAVLLLPALLAAASPRRVGRPTDPPTPGPA